MLFCYHKTVLCLGEVAFNANLLHWPTLKSVVRVSSHPEVCCGSAAALGGFDSVCWLVNVGIPRVGRCEGNARNCLLPQHLVKSLPTKLLLIIFLSIFLRTDGLMTFSPIFIMFRFIEWLYEVLKDVQPRVTPLGKNLPSPGCL